MTEEREEAQLRALRRERMARVKRVLRWMPRRATMHRRPVLKWFAKSARKRPYLWSFRVDAVVPAIYAGCILTMVPLYGIQIPLAVGLAFVLRANLPILVALQWVSNPLTIFPIWFSDYHIGRVSLQLIGAELPHLSIFEIRHLFRSVEGGSWVHNAAFVLKVASVTFLGGAILGSFVGSIGSLLYRMGAREAAVTLAKIHELQARRLARQAEKTSEESPRVEMVRIPKKKTGS